MDTQLELIQFSASAVAVAAAAAASVAWQLRVSSFPSPYSDSR